MKKVFYSLALIAFASLLFSCGGGVEKQIVGKWVVEEVALANIDEIVQSYVDIVGEMSEEDIAEFKKEMEAEFTDAKGTELVFSADKTMTFDGEPGTWELGEGDIINLKQGEGDDSFELIVDKLSGSVFNFTLVIKEDVDINLQMKCKKAE